MKKTNNADKPVSADAIAGMADRDTNVSSFFTGRGRMVPAGVDQVSEFRGIRRATTDPESLTCEAIRRDLASTAPATPAERDSPFPFVRFKHPHPVDLSRFDLDDLLT